MSNKHVLDLPNTQAKLVYGRYGSFLVYPNDTYLGHIMSEYGEYSPQECLLYQQIVQPGWHVVEIGANVGLLTVPLARFVGPQGRVTAFEPRPRIFTKCYAPI